MIEPAPGQAVLVNLVATLLKHGNTPANLDLARIAKHQPFGITEGDMKAEFERQQAAETIDPASLHPSNSWEVIDK